MPPTMLSQIRAARGFLGWSILDLATNARMSVAKVKRFEDGDPRVAGAAGAITAALETAGISFLADDGNGMGLRWKPDSSQKPDLDRASGSLST